MKMISIGFCFLALMTAAPRVLAQDSATQQQLDQITGTLQDLQSQLSHQNDRITAVEEKIAKLTDKLNTPGGSDYASADDLKKLAEQVQEIDQKRQDDNQKILDALAKLGKGGGTMESGRKSEEVTPTPTLNNSPNANAGGPQNGYYYEVKAGNTLLAIAKAYRAQGIKVTVDEILKANPGLTANGLKVGQKIFIPQPQ
jgi:LysM repeat protein